MEITGKLIEIFPLKTGEGKNGTWKKQDYLIETQDKFSKKVIISLWGDKVDNFNYSIGDVITSSIEIESREYNGKWYTDVKAWKINCENKSSESQPNENMDFTKEDFDNTNPPF